MPDLFPDNSSARGTTDDLSVGGHNLRLRHPPRPRSIASPIGRGARRTTPLHTPPLEVFNEGGLDGGDSPPDDDDDLSKNTDAEVQFQNLTFAPPDGHPPATGEQRPALPTMSALARVARESLLLSTPTSLRDDLAWQSFDSSNATAIKVFRSEALQQVELRVFAYMRPHSPFVHLLHSAATFFATGGDSLYKGKDIGYAGDRTPTQTPTPIILKPDVWKWVAKKVVLDIVRLEMFYANPENQQKLWCPVNRDGQQTVHVPRLLFLPPPFVEFCTGDQKTPFELHNAITQYTVAAAPGLQVQLLCDWCITASMHIDNNPLTSTLATAMDAVVTSNEVFHRWTQRRLESTLGNSHRPTITAAAPPIVPPQLVSTAPSGDMWAQVAANLTQSIVNAASALNPTPTPATTTSQATNYEEGGKFYDAYQLAVLQGFAHSPTVAGVPPIWALFQHTKHIDTHIDNIKKSMMEWSREKYVGIDRSILFLNTTMREILSLRFNPGNTLAVYSAAERGMSILICRTRSGDDKESMRLREMAEEMSRGTRTLAEAEKLTAFGPRSAPEDYNELIKCIGTYCALLHTLFGPLCEMYRQCFNVWKALDSEHVSDRRQFFTPLFCRQVVWAIIEDGRSYFATRLSPDNFVVQDPSDIEFPSCKVSDIEPHIRHQTPILRSTFPAQWQSGYQQTTLRGGSTGLQPTIVGAHEQSLLPPIPAVHTGGLPSPSVISAISTGNTSARPNTIGGQIRQNNVHPVISTTMGPYIQKFKSVMLTRLAEFCGCAIADLPTLPEYVRDGTNTLCYNYVLGKCVHKGCRMKNGHAPATAVTAEFATALIARLQPGITEFMTNGPPGGWDNNGGRGKRRRE